MRKTLKIFLLITGALNVTENDFNVNENSYVNSEKALCITEISAFLFLSLLSSAAELGGPWQAQHSSGSAPQPPCWCHTSALQL